MSCEHLRRDLDAYLDRELKPEAAAAIDQVVPDTSVTSRPYST